MLTHCFNLLVDLTAVEDVMEIQEVKLIKTDGCSFDIVADFAECHDERDIVKSNKGPNLCNLQKIAVTARQ